MPLALYTLVALVREFLPHMMGQREGAIMAAAGASAMLGMPAFPGPGPAPAAQRNYLRFLQAEVGDAGVYVGRLYIGAVIAGSAWHAKLTAAEPNARPRQARGSAVDPVELADLLWTMHHATGQHEALYPENALAR